MITHIKGRLSEKSPTNVVIETNGIGYWINISLTTFSQIPDQENIKLFTHLQIKEDSHSLYGFYTLKEREIFRLLISVSGVGTSTARTMLSSLTPEQVIDSISSNNVSVVNPDGLSDVNNCLYPPLNQFIPFVPFVASFNKIAFTH